MSVLELQAFEINIAGEKRVLTPFHARDLFNALGQALGVDSCPVPETWNPWTVREPKRKSKKPQP